MTVTLVRYDAAKKALAAASRVDEVKRIHDKATALLAYARQAGDYELQNTAAEIRILAERKAGQLLVDMGVSGQRQAKQNGRPRKVSSTTRLPTTLPKLGITHDQSSKWQRLARLVDDDTFEEALSRAKDVYGELTTAEGDGQRGLPLPNPLVGGSNYVQFPIEVSTEAHHRYHNHARCAEADDNNRQPSQEPTAAGAAAPGRLNLWQKTRKIHPAALSSIGSSSRRELVDTDYCFRPLGTESPRAISRSSQSEGRDVWVAKNTTHTSQASVVRPTASGRAGIGEWALWEVRNRERFRGGK
jgi:hypothetical protein